MYQQSQLRALSVSHYLLSSNQRGVEILRLERGSLEVVQFSPHSFDSSG